MSVVMARIDNRLLHGIIVTQNVQSYKALIARGVKVTAQFVPADKPVSVADLI